MAAEAPGDSVPLWRPWQAGAEIRWNHENSSLRERWKDPAYRAKRTNVTVSAETRAKLSARFAGAMGMLVGEKGDAFFACSKSSP